MAEKRGMTRKQIKSHYDRFAVKKYQAGEEPSNLDYVEHTGKLLSKPRLISDETREKLQENLKWYIDQFGKDSFRSSRDTLVVAKSKEILGDYEGALHTYNRFLDHMDAIDKAEGTRHYSTNDEDRDNKMMDSITQGVASLEKKMGRDLSHDFERKGDSYYNSVANKLKRLSTRRNLTTHLSSVIAIAGLGAGIFFLSSNLTGNVIGNMTNSTSNIIGAVSFLAGVVGAFFYFRRR